ncbi:unnamed protein product, partial [Phaeothamnion confervicola]
ETAKPTTKSKYVGCFGDRVGARTMPHQMASVATSKTPVTTCVSRCRAAGYPYAGLEYGGECWCGNSYNRYGESTACTMPCSGLPRVVCGGADALSAYRI